MNRRILLLIVCALFWSSCESGTAKLASIGQHEKECFETYNPYNDGSGYDVGYKWARKMGGTCDGHPHSFKVGCLEYYRQLTEYNKYMANRRTTI